jgi:diguanylate cyclase (GGDEF)-like protein
VTILAALSPRDPRIAGRMLGAMVASGALALLLTIVVDPDAGHAGLRWSLAGALVVVGGLVVLPPSSWLTATGLGFGIPVLGVGAWTTFGVLTQDISPGLHAFLALPVMYAGAQLRAAAAMAVLGCTLLAEAIAFFTLQGAADAVVNLAYIGIALSVLSGLLIRLTAQQDRLVAQLERLAAVDSLTGLVSRRVLDDALSSAVSAGFTDEGTALLLVDVDRFKQINDVHGHPVGDQALVHIAAVLSGSIRARDAVVSRVGGDEMAILLPGCAAETAARRAEDLVTAVRRERLRLSDGTEVPLSVSIGVAHAPRHVQGLGSLYSTADRALYRAKRGGRDRFAVAPTA